jgi:hypothetical protein
MSIISKQLKSIESGLTPQEICQAAGIDYQIHKHPISYQNDNGEYTKVKDKFAVVNDYGNVLSIAGNHWGVFQNIDIVKTAYESFKKAGLSISRAGEFADGKRIACVGNWNKGIEVGLGDIVRAEVLLIGSHEVGIGHELRAYFERLVCTNGLTKRIKATKIFGHTESGVKSLSEALENLDMVAAKFQNDSQLLAKTPISYEQALALLIKEFGNPEKLVEEQPRVVKSVIELFAGEAMGSDLATAYNTAWGLLNCLTEYYTHEVHSKDKLKSITSGIASRRATQLNSILLAYARPNQTETQTQTQGVSVRI